MFYLGITLMRVYSKHQLYPYTLLVTFQIPLVSYKVTSEIQIEILKLLVNK